MGLLVRNAADAVDPPRFERKEMRALDAAGVARLLRAAQGSELQAIIAVAVGTGLRRGELLALRPTSTSMRADLPCAPHSRPSKALRERRRRRPRVARARSRCRRLLPASFAKRSIIRKICVERPG